MSWVGVRSQYALSMLVSKAGVRHACHAPECGFEDGSLDRGTFNPGTEQGDVLRQGEAPPRHSTHIQISHRPQGLAVKARCALQSRLRVNNSSEGLRKCTSGGQPGGLLLASGRRLLLCLP